MNIPITDREDIKKQRRLKNENDPFWGIFLRFLVCCAIIDALLIGYFHLIKGVSLVEGLKQWQTSARLLIREPEEQKEIQRIITIIPPQEKARNNPTVGQNYSPRGENEHHIPKQKPLEFAAQQNSTKQKILFSWTESSGYKGYSNKGFPTDRQYTDPQITYY